MELLSPAGSMECLLAAARNGADAVYLGGKSLNARQGAGNFDREELKQAGDYLHERGKKLYVTVNTVVKQSELGLLEDVAEQLCYARADAAIVQDAGVCGYLRKALPGLKLHASTQMAICNAQGASYLKQRGFERAVLAREMSLDEIRSASDTGIETEVFCHGALCVACSGLCLFSSMVGSRSGNRGLCAQPCRMKYRLQGAAESEGYLLSPKDLCAAGFTDALKSAHVASLKIEGRLKRPEYVAIVTNIYRRILDGEGYTKAHEEALRQIFNRGGFTRGYAYGIKDGEFLSTARPSHQGVRVGKAQNGRIILEKDVHIRDALAVRGDSFEDEAVKLEGKAGQTLPNPTGRTGGVFRQVSFLQMEEAEKSYASEKPTIAVRAALSLKTGESAALRVSDGELEAAATGETVQVARSAPLDAQRLTQQLKKTGGTAYFIEDVQLDASPDAFVPVSEVNRLRREALDELARLRTERNSPKLVCQPLAGYPVFEEQGSEKIRIFVQSCSEKLNRLLLERGADEAVYEPNDVRAEALDKLHIDGMYLYLPPVLGEKSLEGLHTFAAQSGIKGVYVTNPGQLVYTWPGEIRYDFTLNFANTFALEYAGVGENVYTPSIELTAHEIAQLGGRRELVLYGRIPLMRLRHCPLNAARGGGLHASCRACDTAKEGKRLGDCSFADRTKAVFPLRRLATDEGCVINLLNSVPLNLSGRTNELPAFGSARLIFTDETEAEAQSVLGDFISALRGALPVPPKGKYTTGHYFRKTE